MVTVKRKITSETDRYGGYDSVIDLDDVKEVSYTNDIDAINYSSLQSFCAPSSSTTDFMPKIIGKTKPEVKVKRQKAQKSEQARKSAPRINAEGEIKEEISLKTKIMLCVYILSALILAAVVIGTGVAISNATGRVNALERQIMSYNAIIAEQNEELLVLSNEDAIIGKAYNDLGMVKVEDYVEIDMIDLIEVNEEAADSNFFNDICKFLSRLFT